MLKENNGNIAVNYTLRYCKTAKFQFTSKKFAMDKCVDEVYRYVDWPRLIEVYCNLYEDLTK